MAWNHKKITTTENITENIIKLGDYLFPSSIKLWNIIREKKGGLLAVRGKNSTGWRMTDAVVPHAATPSMTSPAAGSTKGV
jgi:hypothetical protein